MNNANNSGRVYRPYRKASEYLGHSQKSAIPPGQKSSLEMDNEALQQKVLLLTRKLEHAEAEYMQSREYLESQLDVALVKFNKVTDQYKKLQSSYVALQTNNRELENKVSKINRLEDDKSSMVKEINDLTRKVTDSRSSLLKSQEENERLRKDCNLAVQLLKCNQSSYQTTKPEQVPQELQDRVNDYQVQLHDYNEYINPYMDGDSDSDNEDPYRRKPPAHNPPQMTNGISTDFLAQVLQKPENVHMNLEASDYIRDPQLTSTYKARYTEKKLIRPDYGNDGLRHNNQQHPRTPHDQAPASESSSPWEMNPQASIPPPSADPSPWERRAMPSSAVATEDDGPSAGAYGAYAVGSRRKQPRSNSRMRAEVSSTRLDRHLPAPRKQEQRESFHVPCPLQKPQDDGERFRVPTPPSSPDDIEFRRPAESSDAYIASNFFSRTIAPASSSSLSSSKSSSRKSSPLKVRGKERASKAETSSLLDQENSGEEEEDHRHQKSPAKSYRTPGVVEGNSLLREEEEDDFERVYEAQEINLEWDSSIDKLDGPNDIEEISASSPDNVALPVIKSAKEPQSNLLLSYNDEPSPVSEQEPLPSGADLLPADVANLLADTTLTDSDTAIPSNEQTPSDPCSSGQLLSEIVHGHPLFQDFLLTTTPPPPQQFATAEDPDPSSLYKLVHEESSEQVLGLPNRVDEQILVIDVDQETPPQANFGVEEESSSSSENRRRASFEEARNHGNVMD